MSEGNNTLVLEVSQRPKPKSRTRIYFVWWNMIGRCEDTKNKRYDRYGGRGIKVCERWRRSFDAFIKDMGDRPTPLHQIDRKDNDGDYEPGNCRWATRGEQSRNKSTNKILEYEGARLTLIEWSEKTGLPYSALLFRIKSGWPVARALTEPVASHLEAGMRGNESRRNNRKPPIIYFHKDSKCWCITIEKKRIRLGKDKDAAEDQRRAMLSI